MLTGIRNIFSKGPMRYVLVLLMGLLVLSFAVWGIGDIFRSGGRNVVASIGSVEINVPQFQQSYNREVQQFSRQIGKGITPDQARAMGLDKRVIQSLLTEAALDETVASLKLAIDEEGLRKRATDNPSFRGPSGQFDRSYFNDLLRQNGYTEQSYFDLDRRIAARQQLSAAFTEKMVLPDVLANAIHQYQFETRAASYVALTRANAGEIPTPKPEELATFFERKKSAFRSAETRKIVVLAITPQDQAAFIDVSDAAVDEQLKNLSAAQEKRKVDQLRFSDRASADIAAKRLKEGLSFDDLAKEMKVAESDLTLGTVARADIIDSTVREAAFALPDNAVSDVLNGRFGAIIVRVGPLQKADTAALKDQMRQRLIADKARDQANLAYDKIEKERASGLPLLDLARKLGFEPVAFELDRQGLDETGAAQNVPGSTELVSAVFRSDVGIENDPLQPKTGGFIWYEVTGITPARDRSLEEIKDKVEAAWREDEAKARLGALANDLVASLNKGQTLAVLAKDKGLEVKTLKPVNRSATDTDFGASAVQMLFATAKGQAATAPTADGDPVVFVTSEVSDPEPGKRDAVGVENFVKGMEDDLFAQFISARMKELKAVTYDSMLRRAAGSGSDLN
jgi:peptidyl-prolyl cis-trans isomerase D